MAARQELGADSHGRIFSSIGSTSVTHSLGLLLGQSEAIAHVAQRSARSCSTYSSRSRRSSHPAGALRYAAIPVPDKWRDCAWAHRAPQSPASGRPLRRAGAPEAERPRNLMWFMRIRPATAGLRGSLRALPSPQGSCTLLWQPGCGYALSDAKAMAAMFPGSNRPMMLCSASRRVSSPRSGAKRMRSP